MNIWKDRRGVAEEFTSLPLLAVVMIGFAIFFLIISGAYVNHSEKSKNLEMEEVAHYIIYKLTSFGSPITDGAMTVDMNKWISSNMKELRNFCKISSYNYSLMLEVDGIKYRKGIYPAHRIIVSRYVAIKFSNGDVKYGKIYAIVWEEK